MTDVCRALFNSESLAGSINLDGLSLDWDELVSVPKEYWQEDAKEVRKFIETQVCHFILIGDW